MRGIVVAFITTLLLGVVGMLIDSNVGLDGNFSVVLAISAMGSFILYAIKNRKTK